MEETSPESFSSDIDEELIGMINNAKTNIFVVGTGKAENNTISTIRFRTMSEASLRRISRRLRRAGPKPKKSVEGSKVENTGLGSLPRPACCKAEVHKEALIKTKMHIYRK